MGHISLPVVFLDAYSRRSVDFDLSGDASEQVQTLLQPLSGTPSSFHVFVNVEGNTSPSALVADVTLAQLAEVSDILDKDERGRIRVDNGGRGGDPLPTLIDLINVIGYITTPYAMGKAAHKTWHEMVYGRKQRAAQDWLRGGREDVLNPLRGWVRGPHSWQEDQFERVFAVHGADAYRLLRAAGYEYRDDSKTWFMIESPEPSSS